MIGYTGSVGGGDLGSRGQNQDHHGRQVHGEVQQERAVGGLQKHHPGHVRRGQDVHRRRTHLRHRQGDG